jgi:hypothetical protein
MIEMEESDAHSTDTVKLVQAMSNKRQIIKENASKRSLFMTEWNKNKK